MVQDSVLWKSRRYRGYREPEVIETSEFEELENSVFTYVGTNVSTLTKTKTLIDGTIQTKTYTFTYDGNGNVQSITQVLV